MLLLAVGVLVALLLRTTRPIFLVRTRVITMWYDERREPQVRFTHCTRAFLCTPAPVHGGAFVVWGRGPIIVGCPRPGRIRVGPQQVRQQLSQPLCQPLAVPDGQM